MNSLKPFPAGEYNEQQNEANDDAADDANCYGYQQTYWKVSRVSVRFFGSMRRRSNSRTVPDGANPGVRLADKMPAVGGLVAEDGQRIAAP
jgi:hypothetical protein